MAKLIYNKVKNTNINYFLFKFNYKYHLILLFENKINLYLRFCFAYKLAKELNNLIKIYY